jgi:Tol biopolymer transport system component
LIFASLRLDSSIWGLVADTDRGRVTGELKKVTDGPLDVRPSISLDGRKLAFVAKARGAPPRPQVQLRVRDLLTQRETAAAVSEGVLHYPAMRAQISHDGILVAYAANEASDIYMARLGSGPKHTRVGNVKGFLWDWSWDDHSLLFSKFGDEGIHQVDVSSGGESSFLRKAGYELYQAKFSPDNRAVILIGCDSHRPGMQCRIFVVPLNSDGSPEADKWIAIDHSSPWDDKPRWSPNGNLIYFVSDRDGHLCLWAQRLDRITKQPNGAPFPVWHFHTSRLAMINIGTAPLEIDVARDKIVMAAGELTGNIWSLKR